MPLCAFVCVRKAKCSVNNVSYVNNIHKFSVDARLDGVTSEQNGIRRAFWVFAFVIRSFFFLCIVINARRTSMNDARNHRCHISVAIQFSYKQRPYAKQRNYGNGKDNHFRFGKKHLKFCRCDGIEKNEFCFETPTRSINLSFCFSLD